MKKRIVLLTILLGLGIGMASGCAEKEDTVAVAEETTHENMKETPTQAEETSAEETETEGWVEERTHESKQASVVLDDGEIVYFCGRDHILKWNSSNQSTEKIWISDKAHVEKDSYMYSCDRGILINDKIYFIERWQETPQNTLAPGTVQALSVVNTDGNGYREIARISENEEAQLLLLDGILYYSQDMSTKALKGYVVDASGELAENLGEVVNEPVNIPKDSLEISYYDNGVRKLTAVESAYYFGYYLLRDEEYSLCLIDQNTGEKQLLFDKVGNATPVSFNSTYFLFMDYMTNELFLMDNRTWERTLLGSSAEGLNIIGMDEEYVYWQRYDDNMEQYFYERITLDGVTTEGLFEIDSFTGMMDDSPWYLMDISVINNDMYYVNSKDYKYYLVRRDIGNPTEEETIGEAFYDSGISRIGSITAYRENVFSETDPELILCETDLEWLVVDERFPGAAKINAVLDGEQQENMHYGRTLAKDMEEWAADGMTGSISSNVSPVYYFNERFISFTQQTHEYSGGAHGMPYWIPHTFDLQTGEELGLKDFVANDEEEFKEIVTEQFEEMYHVDPELFWDDAINTVRENSGFEASFYLRKDGLVIYYGPYDLAAYAAGFIEIVVPYDKLELYIPIGE